MKNLSIRIRILASVVLINLLGGVLLVFFLHGSYADGLNNSVTEAGVQGLDAWEQLIPPDGFHPVAEPTRALDILGKMKAITHADYVLLVYADAVDEATYTHARESLGEAAAWTSSGEYALLASTDEDVASRVDFGVPAGDVPDTSKGVGMEVGGACSATCHSAGDTGDYWVVRGSDTDVSLSHAVFPVYSGASDPIGVIYTVKDISPQADEAARTLLQTLLGVGITLLAATLTIGALMDILVLRRLARMTHHIQEVSTRLAGGDFDVEFQADGTTDEIGAFEKFYANFISLVSDTLKQLLGDR